MLVRQFKSIRWFLLITIMSFTISMAWIRFVDTKVENDLLAQEAIQNVGRDIRYTDVYRRTDKLPKDLKYMLLWSNEELAPFSFFGNGQRKFIEKNCSNINCYVTTNRNLFNGDTTKFDAIAFNGRTVMTTSKSRLPKYRSPHQKFIYFNMESADNFPVCFHYYDDFFNWTSTYRLDSDIPFPYIQVQDTNGEVVGPRRDMKWIEMDVFDNEELELRLRNKTKAVAWFVSRCPSRSHRKNYVIQLQKALQLYGYTVDIYGKCGQLKCPRQDKDVCFRLLERDYAFYLSFENSFAEDYVTEKLLTALQNSAVPIVRGGANYSRFLPPGSYIDAGNKTPQDLAFIIGNILMNTKYYTQFFRWRSHYSYRDPALSDNVCAMCKALNNKTKMEETSTYKDFRKWWYPNYKDRCKY